MAKKKCSDGSISGLTVDWGKDMEHGGDNAGLPYSGQRVQEFIKNQFSGLTESKIGYYEIHKNENGDQKNYLYAFKNEEDFESWKDSNYDHDSELILVKAQIPDAEIKINTYESTVYLDNAEIIVNGDSAYINVGVVEEVLKVGSSATTFVYETGKLKIRSNYGTATKTVPLASVSGDTAGPEKYTKIDVSEFIVDNATVTLSLNWTSNNSTSSTKTCTLTKTSVGITFKNNWQVPITPNNNFSLTFGVTGNVDKYVYLYFPSYYGEPEETSQIGGIPYNTMQKADGDTVDFGCYTGLTEGVYSGSAWVETSNKAYDPIYFQVYVSAQQQMHVVFNNVESTVTNWSLNHVLDYAICSKSSALKFVFWSGDLTKEYYTYTTDTIATNTQNSLSINLEIDVETSSDVPMIVRVYDAETEDITSETDPLNSVSINLDNSENFAPTDLINGFIFNPQNRTNGSDKESVYNYATGEEITGVKWENMDWVNGGWITDSDVTDDDGNVLNSKCLRILAGSKVTIPYSDYYIDTTNAYDKGITIEIDAAFRNCSDTDEEVITISNDDGYGITMYPTRTTFATRDILKSSSDLLDYDVDYRTDSRTHITVNIVPQYSLSYYAFGATQPATASYPLIRIFVNGTINREFVFADKTNDDFGNITDLSIGSNTCDVDLYGIRVYKNQELSVLNIQNDYNYSIPSFEKKKAWKAKNNISKSNNDVTISYSAASKCYNTLLWNGTYPCHEEGTENPSYTGTLKILCLTDNVDENGNYIIDENKSCTITNMSAKGQGHTAMYNYKFNSTWKFKSNSVYYSIDADGNETALSGHSYYQMSGTTSEGDLYALTAKATKLVGKLNYASSMQSHKEGSLRMYEALKKQMISDSPTVYSESYLQQNHPDDCISTSVYEEPFLLFVNDGATTDARFYGLMTFGPAKGDENTFGMAQYQHGMWIGGSEQETPLTLGLIPWTNDKVTYGTPNNKDYGWMYNGALQFDIECDEDKSDTTYETGNIAYIRDYLNLVFTNSYRIKPWSGSSMPTETEEPDFYDISKSDILYQYWISNTVSSNYGNVYYYDYETNKWLDVGVESGISKVYNVFHELEEYGVTTSAFAEKSNDQDRNELIKQKRAQNLREHVGEYADIADILTCFCYTLFIAASDNLAKNSYFYTDEPKDANSKPLIRVWRDDDDTIFRINNKGQKDKPYWVELHTISENSGSAEKEENVYFTASKSGYYGTLYYAYHEFFVNEELLGHAPTGNSITIQSVMHDMLKAMTEIGQTPYLGDAALNCFRKYFFSVQEYFPSVAYNETARLLYEESELRTQAGQSVYTAGYTTPMPASLGDSLQGELQFLKMRTFFMETFCKYYSNGLSLNLAANQDVTVTAGAHMYIYGIQNVSPVSYTTQYPKLLNPEESYTYTIGNGGNSSSVIVGTQYLSGLGNFWEIQLNGKQNVALESEFIRAFYGGNEDGNKVNFAPSTISTLPKSLETLDLRNVTTLGGTLDLSTNIRLNTILLDNTSIISLVLPKTQSLKSLSLPTETLTTLTINKCPSLDTSTLKIEEISSLRNLTIYCHCGTNDYYGTHSSWLTTWYNNLGKSAVKSSSLTLDSISWSMTCDEIKNLISIVSQFKLYSLTGKITISDESNFDSALAKKIRNAFGANAFSSTAPLYFEVNATFNEVEGASTIQETKSSNYELFVLGLGTIQNFEWSISGADASHFSLSNQTSTGCTVTCGPIDADTSDAKVCVKFTTLNNGIALSLNSELAITGLRTIYPSSADTHISGTFQIFKTGATEHYSIASSNKNVTAECTLGPTYEHGEYYVEWTNSDIEQTLVTASTSESTANQYDVTALQAPLTALTFNMTAHIWYEGKEQFSVQKTVYVGTRVADTFGYIYCNDGILYPTINDIPFDVRPIGVCVVPARHTDRSDSGTCKTAGVFTRNWVGEQNTSRIMSLAEMNVGSPESGSTTSYQGIYWGGYPFDISGTTENPEYGLPNLTIVPNISGGTHNYPRLGSETAYNSNFKFHNDSYHQQLNGYPEELVDNLWYYSTSDSALTTDLGSFNGVAPSPFAGQSPFSGVNVGFNYSYAGQYLDENKKPKPLSGIGSNYQWLATRDFNGRENTLNILRCATGQNNDVEGGNWIISSAITNSYGLTFYPAAECCARYHCSPYSGVQGTNVVGCTPCSAYFNDSEVVIDESSQGDWYLPSCGELGYIVTKFAAINELINNLIKFYATEGYTDSNGNQYTDADGYTYDTSGNRSTSKITPHPIAKALHATAWYWSSSEYASNYARNVTTLSGGVNNYGKSNYFYVRAFLAF